MGSDRWNIGQLEYTFEAGKTYDNVVVVLNGGGIEMASWLPRVKAVLMAWYPGQQGGMAVSEIITGRISPSGRLPISIEKTLADNPVNENYYENVDRMRPEEINPYSRVEYREGVFVGYRGYEKNNVEHLWRISVLPAVLPAVLPLRRSKVSIRKSRFCVLIA